MSARDRILARLRAAEPGEPVMPPDVAAHYARRARLSPGERLDQLCARLVAARADVRRAHPDDWAQVAAEALDHRRVRRLAVGRCARTAQLVEALPAHIEAVCFEGPVENWKHTLFSTVDAGFTPASAGIAATGALLIDHGGALPRTLSLVPPVSLVCVDARQLYDDLHHASGAQRWRDDMPANRVLVSSPSRTADIQQTLAYGAHGPRELVVVVIDDEVRA